MKNIVILDNDIHVDGALRCAAAERLNGVVVSPEGFQALPADEEHGYIVFMTGMYKGVLWEHKQLFESPAGQGHWIVAVVGYDSGTMLRKECERDIDRALSNSGRTHETLFISDTEALDPILERLKLPPKRGRLCRVISRNAELGGRVAELIASGLQGDWTVEYAVPETPADYQRCDAVLAVGRAPEDLRLPAPDTGVGRYHVWLDVAYPPEPDERQELLAKLQNVMSAAGWKLAHYDERTRMSSLKHEQVYMSMQRGELSCTMLAGDADFTMWDRVGLPIPEQAYTPETVEAFLRENTCFSEIARGLMGEPEKRA